jgi:molybdopterin-biosynthesis enzyme MoeA-like protein
MPVEKDAAVVLHVTGSAVEGDDSEDEEEIEEVKAPIKKKRPERAEKQVKQCEVCLKRHRGECTNVEAWRLYLQKKMESELAEKLKKIEIKAVKPKGKTRVGALRVLMDGTGSDED